MHQIRPDHDAATSLRNNPHATPTPNDLSTSFRLVQDQLGTLASSAPTSDNLEFLRRLIEMLDIDIANPPYEEGVSQQFLDSLDRVSRKQLKKTDSCAICAEPHLDDPYCLVVELPCHSTHRFDLECVSPWLLTKGTCPMCRKDLVKKRAPEPKDDEEGEEYDDFYG